MKKTLSVIAFLLIVLCIPSAAAQHSVCTSWDVRKFCCPGACAVTDSQRAGAVLRGCMAGLKCPGSDNASTFQVCSCR
jgi:hypothetical protein